MVRLADFIAACLIFLCATSFAHAETGQDLVNGCQTLIQGIKPDSTNRQMIELPSDAGANQCWGYFLAVQQYATLVDANQTRITATCPNNTTLTQIIQAFLAYASANPKALSENAGVASYNMMHQVYPCN
jgi:Rap1a immunity proteins